MAAMDSIAEEYVRLVLAAGVYDENLVDAYYGPPEWREQAEKSGKTPEVLAFDARRLRQQLASLQTAGLDELGKARHRYLTKQLRAVAARIDFRRGEKMGFDEEARALYDAEPPTHDAAHFDALLEKLDDALPGSGDLSERLQRFRDAFVIPPEKLDAVFTAAIEEARKRTAAKIELPEGESFEVEYVTDKPWSGYNWYKGNAHSLIQVNTDLPITIDRAVDLACHEGYPGHHVYNVLLEQHMVRERGWQEFTVYPLFSPQSLIAEGTANFGIRVAFPGADRLAFEREVLFPLAGLDPERVAQYYAVMEMVQALTYAGNEAARHTLDGDWDDERAVDWLVTYGLFSRARAGQRLRFIETYRAYVINYNLGQDMVAAHVDAAGGTANRPDRRWAVFTELLSQPMVPSSLSR